MEERQKKNRDELLNNLNFITLCLALSVLSEAESSSRYSRIKQSPYELEDFLCVFLSENIEE